MNLRQVYGSKEKISDDIVDRYYELLLREGNRETFIDICNRKPDPLALAVSAAGLKRRALGSNTDRIIE
jgi:hypothetical protein